MELVPELQDLLDDALRRHDIPGAVVGVARGGERAVAAGGVLNRNTGVAATPDSLFQIGSVTKVWTAALVLQLVDEGAVKLDGAVRRYLPEFALPDAAAAEAVTVRQLLAHTGGFVGDLFEDTGPGDDALELYLKVLARDAAQVHPPGALISYCNSGYCVLGALVARLRGTTWEAALRDRLIDPLGLEQHALSADEAILFRTAAGHTKAPGSDRVSVFPRWSMPRSNAPAGATLCLTAGGLLSFGRMMLDGGVAGGTRVLSEAAVAAMRTPQIDVPGGGGRRPRHWGLGLMLFDWGTPVYGHDGGTIGQNTALRVLPEHDLVVAAVSNGGPYVHLHDEVLAPVLRDLAGVELPAYPIPPDPPRPFAGARHAGTYAVPEETWRVSDLGDRLRVTMSPAGRMQALGAAEETLEMVPLDGDTYIATTAPEGVHPTVTFTDGYLHASRAIPRADGDG
ncbi:MAG TPA: serine hydrolase domain-containing protein [Mycobacteriales bacterium]